MPCELTPQFNTHTFEQFKYEEIGYQYVVFEMPDENIADQEDTLSVTRRTAIKSLAGMAGIGVGALTLPGRASAATGGYVIRNVKSKKALEVAGWSTSNGANIQQWEFHGGANQQWYLTPLGGNVHRIQNVNSQKTMEVEGWGTDNGDNVQQWEYFANPNQQWYLVDLGSGFYRIVNVNSNKALEVAGASTANGANVQQWEFNGGNHQRWHLRKI